MKSLRCKAKTRKGVLLWLSAFNPFMLEEPILHSLRIVAVHIHRHTGAIVSYELQDNTLLPIEECHPSNFLFIAA